MNRSLFNKAPKNPGVYALYAGTSRNKYVVYVGIANNIRQRLIQHFIRRDSSIVTGVSAVSLNPDKITEVRWWCFSNEESKFLREAEVVAFSILNPVLRSRAPISLPVQLIADSENFKSRMGDKFKGNPSGHIEFMSHQELLAKVIDLETIVKKITKKN